VKEKIVFRARASLIDRLTDLQPAAQRETRPLRTLSRQKLKESIRQNLHWLLNTRTSIPAAEYDRRELTVIDFGMPDFGPYFTAAEEDRQLLVRRLLRAIAFFEPRLQDVEISVQPSRLNERALLLVIDAAMRGDTVKAPVSFLTVLQGKSASVEINENE